MNFGCCFFSGGLLCAARAKWVHNLALPCLCSAQKCAHPCTHGAHGACYAQSTRAAYEACFKSASLFVYFGLRAEELLSSRGDLGIHLFSALKLSKTTISRDCTEKNETGSKRYYWQKINNFIPSKVWTEKNATKSKLWYK